MKYYIEYKGLKEFEALCKHYNNNIWSYVDPLPLEEGWIHQPCLTVEEQILNWFSPNCPYPPDAKKITFEEWKEMMYLETKLNSKSELEWKKGAYVRYLGTKEGKNNGDNWEKYFNIPGLKAGDVGIINNTLHGKNTWIKDNIRSTTNGQFTKQDLQLITKEEYEAGLRNPSKKYEFNEGDLVIVTKINNSTSYNLMFKSGEIIKLGGKYWNTKDHTIDKVNNFENIDFISKSSPKGDSYTNQKYTKFRHCTPDEIAYFNKAGLGANINDMKKEDISPFKIGDEITILSKPKSWNGGAGGENGINEVSYPYTFIIENILYYDKVCGKDCIDMFDGKYDWYYCPELFVKSESKSDDDWKIAVHTDEKGSSRPWVSEQEAIDRLNSIINKTPLILTTPKTQTGVFEDTTDTVIPKKKQSLTEQLCKIIEKEPDNIPVTNLFPSKKKSIINQLKF
jgi:hypothetical protein